MITVHSSYAHDFDRHWKLEESRTESNILLFITKGSLYYWIDKEEVHLQKGEALFIPQGSLRYGASDQVSDHKRYSTHFSLHVQPKDNPWIRNLQRHWKVTISNPDYIKQRYVTLNQQWLAKFPYYSEICQAILCEILSIMMRDKESALTPSIKVGHIMELKKYIFHHYREKILLKELADHIDRTPNYVSTIFKEVTGQTPVEYIQSVRISAAKEILVNHSMSIAEVADYLGFCDPFYFHHVFKKVTGHAPSALLKDRKTIKRKL